MLKRFTNFFVSGQVFPNLKTLLIADNPISNFHPKDQIPVSFPFLTSLSIKNTAISNWEHIDSLQLFPAMVDVQISEVPVFEVWEHKFTKL